MIVDGPVTNDVTGLAVRMGNARNGDTGRAHRNPAFSSFAEQDEHAIDEVVARFGELIRIDLVQPK